MKRFDLVVSIVLVLFILFLANFIFSSFSKKFLFEVKDQSVLFVSNSSRPLEFLNTVSWWNSFVVSPEFTETGTTVFMAQALTVFNSVLVSEGKKVQTIARVVDSEKNLLFCQVNDGNVLENKRIESQDCLERFEGFEGIVFFVDLPESVLSDSVVEVKQKSVIVKPKNFEEVSRVSFVVLSKMFPGSRQSIEEINRIVGRVG